MPNKRFPEHTSQPLPPLPLPPPPPPPPPPLPTATASGVLTRRRSRYRSLLTTEQTPSRVRSSLHDTMSERSIIAFALESDLEQLSAAMKERSTRCEAARPCGGFPPCHVRVSPLTPPHGAVAKTSPRCRLLGRLTLLPGDPVIDAPMSLAP